jgi:hypothetical protein
MGSGAVEEFVEELVLEWLPCERGATAVCGGRECVVLRECAVRRECVVWRVCGKEGVCCVKRVSGEERPNPKPQTLNLNPKP